MLKYIHLVKDALSLPVHEIKQSHLSPHEFISTFSKTVGISILSHALCYLPFIITVSVSNDK